jgi:hypothetical protein
VPSESVPDGCAYYCGANARALTGARFTQVGTGRDDAAEGEGSGRRPALRLIVDVDVNVK